MGSTRQDAYEDVFWDDVLDRLPEVTELVFEESDIDTLFDMFKEIKGIEIIKFKRLSNNDGKNRPRDLADSKLKAK